MKKGVRLTRQRFSKEIMEMKEMFPAWLRSKDVVTKAEVLIANHQHAMIKTLEYVEGLNLGQLSALLWLYQFEFFEKEFFIENYDFIYSVNKKDGSMHAKRVFASLIDDELIEIFEERDYTYYEESQGRNYTVLHEKKSNNVYQLSKLGMNIIQVFMTILIKEKPTLIKTKSRVLRYSNRTRDDLNNLNGGWDEILKNY